MAFHRHGSGLGRSCVRLISQQVSIVFLEQVAAVQSIQLRPACDGRAKPFTDAKTSTSKHKCAPDLSEAHHGVFNADDMAAVP